MGRGVREVDSRLVVLGAAVAAAVLRFPGLLQPLGSDESGFTLVARAWDPGPGDLYGPYWVDRPPTLLAFVRLCDAIGGAYFIRVVAALGCAALVVMAAATARAALRYAGESDPRYVSRTGAWTAVLAAAFTSTAMIDPVMAKGEILGIPFVLLSFLLALRALVRPRVDGTALLLAAMAGLAAALAQGMKQNLVAGLVFGTALLVGTRLSHRITSAELARLGAAALGGALVPVVATVVWTLRHDVGLDTLWYAVYGFRSDALEVIAAGSKDAPFTRGLLLVLISLGTGAAFVLAGLVVHRRQIWRLSRTLFVATGIVLAVDGTTLLLGGSFWRPYLFAFVPGLVLATTLLLAVRAHVARRARLLVVLAAVVSVGATAVWTVVDLTGNTETDATRTGLALRDASRPGDTVVVYGGKAEIVLTSGLASPYDHLWTLPMRTLDPDLAGLTSVLEGPQAPTWVVLWTTLSSWDDNGAPLSPLLARHYSQHGESCDGHPVYLRRGADRPLVEPDCDGALPPVQGD